MGPRLLHASIVSATLMFVAGADVARGETYPARPIRIVTAPAGGANDFLARMLAPGLTAGMGQQIVVDNRPAGVIPGQIVSSASPDGYTLLCTTGLLWLLPFMQTVPFDPLKDFLPVTLAMSFPNLLVVHPTVAANSVKELIALARAKPGELNFSSGAGGSNSHLTMELFKSLADINIQRIPYKGEGPAVIGLLGGQVQMMFASASAVAAHAKSGKLRILGISSAQPSTVVPGVPTVAASGLPGFESVTVIGIFAPAKTPAAIVQRLNQEMVQILHKPEVKERFLNAGAEAVGSTPAEFTAMMKADMAKMGRVIKAAGIRTD